MKNHVLRGNGIKWHELVFTVDYGKYINTINKIKEKRQSSG
jgi:hypothetical protein